MIRTFLTEAKGRKTKVKGRVEDLNGVVLVEAECVLILFPKPLSSLLCKKQKNAHHLYIRGTFVQPRYAKLLNTSAVRDALGEPPKGEPVLLADGQTAVPPPKPTQ